MTGRSGRGTARQTIRIDEALWDRLGEACGRVGMDRSEVIREFVRWYVQEPDAKLPDRFGGGAAAGEASDT